MTTLPRFFITGASGQLGGAVITELVKCIQPSQVVGLVRDPSRAQKVAKLGVEIRGADYDSPTALEAALVGAETLLLISSSQVGKRVIQHRNVIAAARSAGVNRLMYTSILRADTNPMLLAEEHRETETLIHESKIPSVILRNGWYTENYTQSLKAIVETGAVFGASADGLISSATRLDYAEAAVRILLDRDTATKNRVYELAGDNAYSLGEFAREISRQINRRIEYRSLTEKEYQAALIGAQIPDAFAAVLADSSKCTAEGALFCNSGELSRIIGRSTTPMRETVREKLLEYSLI